MTRRPGSEPGGGDGTDESDGSAAEGGPAGLGEPAVPDTADTPHVVVAGEETTGADDGWADDGWADDGWADDEPGSSWAGHEWEDLGGDARVQAGVEHLQRAANELIAASRALLDVAEELVQDPRSVGGLLGLVADLGDLANRAVRPPRRPGAGVDDGPDDDDPPVQRIPVS